jgi:phosphopantothenoylcysteine decarboxylase/phosphopantothenate--cysteine ligase
MDVSDTNSSIAGNGNKIVYEPGSPLFFSEADLLSFVFTITRFEMMASLQGKKILLGISAGIAAYKSLSLIRLLKKAGANLSVLLTPPAEAFVGKLTPATLAGTPVHSELFDAATGEWTNHVHLGLEADLMLIAPATASTLSKMACGQSDNLLLTTYLSARCPVWVAPAMDLDMWLHPATQRNIRTLIADGVRIVEPAEGELASGLVGKGRMEEPEVLFGLIEKHFAEKQTFTGKKVLITLGPTREALDPVRFISNHSTGKMGGEIASALLSRGAEVCIVAGPVHDSVLPAAAHIYKVESALEMHAAALELFPKMDLAILSAAVADYRPAEVAEQKIKKSSDEMEIRLVKNPDIAASLGSMKKSGQYLLGFALETNNERENALSKLERKNLDAIVLNSLQDPGAGFAHDTNKITILSADGNTFVFETKSKKEVAHDIAVFLEKAIH